MALQHSDTLSTPSLQGTIQRYCLSAQWIGSPGVKTNSKELGRPRQNLPTQILWFGGSRMTYSYMFPEGWCYIAMKRMAPWIRLAGWVWAGKADYKTHNLIELITQAADQRFSRFMHDQHLCQGWHKVSTIHIIAVMPLRMTNKTSLVSSWSDPREVSKPYLFIFTTSDRNNDLSFLTLWCHQWNVLHWYTGQTFFCVKCQLST